MKNNLLFLFCLFLIIPTLSFGAEVYHTLSVDFSFSSSDDPTKQLSGYRLYKEGKQVCETNDPDASGITCDILTEDGTFYFTLTAYYTNNTESPSSPSFPFTIVSVAQPDTSTPEPPTAILSSSTAAGNAPVTVTFDGLSSTTPNSSIVSYKWTFGDGSPAATGTTTSHTFTVAGTYHTELTVIDSEGLSDTISTPIVVIGASVSTGNDAYVVPSENEQEETFPSRLESVKEQASLLSQTQVSQLYVTIFGRASEGEGNTYWQSDQTDMAVAANVMLNTDPAKAYFGDTLNDNWQFIEFIYENTLGKLYAEDPDGVDFWVSELVNGKSKGEVISLLINACMDPQYSGLPAQDQFINKVTVSNYTADRIATCPNVNDLAPFGCIIKGITNDSLTVMEAKAVVDAM